MIKILHTSDFHLGKKLLGVSRLNEQRLFLAAFIDQIKAQMPDVLIIAGDIFDRAMPPEDAVSVFDAFIASLAAFDMHIIILSGNHDSAKRLGLYSSLLSSKKIYLCTDFIQCLSPIDLMIKGQPVSFYAVPYAAPHIVSHVLNNPNIKTHEDVFNYLTGHWNLKREFKHILIAHGYFGNNLKETNSEKPLAIGGTEMVDISHIRAFDYCALGHLHRPQKIAENAYYSGSPLKYSFSEHCDKKRYLIVELTEELNVSSFEIKQPMEVTQIKGAFDDLLASEAVCDDYLSIHLTDKEKLHDPLLRLRYKYPNLLKLTFDFMQGAVYETSTASCEDKNIVQHFKDFYVKIYDEPISDDLCNVFSEVVDKLIKDNIE